MKSMTVFRDVARYNVLTPVALLAAICMTATAVNAEDRVVAEGEVDNDSVALNAGDSLTNAGTISNAPGDPAIYFFPGPGEIAFILNEEGGTISATGAMAIGIDGSLGEFTNHGTIETDNGNGLGVAEDVGIFANSGEITSQDESAVFIGGDVTSFENSGVLTGAGFNVVRFEGSVGSFVNTETGSIVNADALGTDGNGVEFETNGTNFVTTFENHGTITSDLTGANGVGVGFWGSNAVGSFVNSGEIHGMRNGVDMGAFTSFENSGTITSQTNSGVFVIDDSGDFLNSGTISSMGNAAAGFDGRVESFTNAAGGLLSGRRWEAVYFNAGVGHFVNEAGATIQNLDRLGTDGNGVGFNTGTINGGTVTTFENHGVITGDVNSPTSAGVGFFTGGDPEGSQTGSFLNTGSIYGANRGVNSAGGFASFENSGTITSTNSHAVNMNGPVGSFTNSGTIGSQNGIGVRFGVGATSFANSGDITSATARGVQFDALVESFENSGTIESFQNGVSFNGGFLAASNSGSIVATAPGGEIGVRIDEPGGTFTNSGRIEGPAAVVYILNTAGDNVFINSGVLRGINTAINFSDGADGGNDTLRIRTGSELYGAVDFGAGDDTLDFSDFDGSALVEIHGLDGETLIAGDNAYVFDEAADVVGIVSPGGVTAAGQVVAVDIAGQVTNLVDSALSGVAAPAADEMLLGYAPMPAQSEAEQAMVVHDPVVPSNKIWGSVFGGGSRDEAPDLSNVFGGIVAGSHAEFVPGTVLGLLGGYVASHLETNGDQTIDTHTGVLGIYGRHTAGIVEIDFSVLGGWSGHDSDRDFVALGVAETASADYSSWFLAPTLGAAVPVLATESGEMRVAARVGYVGGKVEGYSETGSTMNLTVGSQSISLLDGRIGLEGEFGVGGEAAKVLLEAGIFGQSNLGGNSVPVSFLGQTQNVSAPGDSHFGVYAGMDVTADIGGGATVFAGADGSLRDDGMIAGVLKAGLSGSF